MAMKEKLRKKLKEILQNGTQITCGINNETSTVNLSKKFVGTLKISLPMQKRFELLKRLLFWRQNNNT